MNRKIAIGVVTYRPNISLMLRLQNAIAMGFSVYLFDNSPEDGLIKKYFQKYNADIVRYITCGKNVGLGFGISSVCAQAYYDFYPALIYFDQDTVFNCSTLDFIEDFYVRNANLASTYSAIVFNAKHCDDVGIGSRSMIKDVLLAISSGSLFYLKNLNTLNWHNERYFVDFVDYEFCLRSDNNGFKIGEFSMTPGFDHKSEQPDAKHVVFGKERLLRKYSAKRILDTTSASVRLFFTSVITKNIIFSAAIIRYVAAYYFWQLLVRLITVFNPRNGSIK